MSIATCGLLWFGEDFCATIIYHITTYGCRDSYSIHGWEPGWGPEFEIDSITLAQDFPGWLGPEFEATGALFRCLANLTCITDAIYDSIASNAYQNEWED